MKQIVKLGFDPPVAILSSYIDIKTDPDTIPTCLNILWWKIKQTHLPDDWVLKMGLTLRQWAQVMEKNRHVLQTLSDAILQSHLKQAIEKQRSKGGDIHIHFHITVNQLLEGVKCEDEVIIVPQETEKVDSEEISTTINQPQTTREQDDTPIKTKVVNETKTTATRKEDKFIKISAPEKGNIIDPHDIAKNVTPPQKVIKCDTKNQPKPSKGKHDMTDISISATESSAPDSQELILAMPKKMTYNTTSPFDPAKYVGKEVRAQILFDSNGNVEFTNGAMQQDYGFPTIQQHYRHGRSQSIMQLTTGDEIVITWYVTPTKEGALPLVEGSQLDDKGCFKLELRAVGVMDVDGSGNTPPPIYKNKHILNFNIIVRKVVDSMQTVAAVNL